MNFLINAAFEQMHSLLEGGLKEEIWYGMVWYGMVWYGMVWYGMVWYGMVWYGMVWYGKLRYGMAWHGMVWYGMVYCPYGSRYENDLGNLSLKTYDIKNPHKLLVN